MIVQDARQDARFAANPLVTGPPHVRFYAGAPLIDAAGFALGTLCLFDSRPRGLSKPGVDTLRDLAGIVIEQIERSAAGSGIIAGGPSEPMAGGQAAQERMERQELFLNSVLENLSEGVVACDETGRLILFNRSTRQFHGVDDAPVPPEQWAERYSIYRADGQTLMDKSEIPLYRALQGETIRNVEMVIARKGKPRRVLMASGSPMYDKQRRKLGAVVLMRNVTGQIEIEKQLQQAQKMEAVGQLTGGLAHDFNNLLTIVIGNLQLLEQDLASDPKRSRQVNAALEAANRGAKLTRQLLAFSRRQVLEPEIVNLRKHLVELEQLLKRTLGDAIDIHTSIASGTYAINVDSNLLESALLNLAINARDAMNGQGRLTIDAQNVTLDREYAARNQGLKPGDYVSISVSDTGAGMSREVLDRAFEPFFSTKGPGKGTGLGLSMVYAFARQSQGQVKISSEPGRGTRVEIYLPRATAEEIQEEARVTGRYQAIPSGTERVLVVEDNAGVRQIAVKLLQSLGYQTVEAADGWQACEILSCDRDIDLLFTDIVMPGGMNGAELAQKAQALRPSLKVLFTSGYTENTFVQDDQVKPCGALLTKPYQKQELALKVRQVLDELAREAVTG